MYDVNDYGRMMADPVRMHAYTEALRRAVKPGSVVLDVGTGTGIFALLAAKFGARKVYAIDTNPCIHLAREVAQANGLADRIEFIHDSVFHVEPPEKADVIVADCRGALPFYERSLEIVMHARDRWLAPGGCMLGEKDDVFVAAASSTALARDLAANWTVGGFDWNACRRTAATTPHACAWSDVTALLANPAVWVSISYRTITTADVHGDARVVCTQSGQVNCLMAWFRTTLASSFEIDARATDVYRPYVFPLDPPLEVQRGDEIMLRLDALRAKKSYIFAWKATAPSGVRQHSDDAILGQQGLEFSAMRGHLMRPGNL